jgi:hypothetical protein
VNGDVRSPCAPPFPAIDFGAHKELISFFTLNTREDAIAYAEKVIQGRIEEERAQQDPL